ncbi:MAG: DUF1648 domain-containing protein [Clostridia bacterium]|nr:DUF1648 domain-containing protein [Clostridia bacterium]
MKIKIINILIFVASLAITLATLSAMPDTVPVHFDIHGVVDRWGSKYEMLIMPGVMLAMLGFWFGNDAFYKKKLGTSTDEKVIAEARANMKVMDVTSVITSLMFAVINTVTLYASYSQLDGVAVKEVDILKILAIVMGVSFVLIGNFMPKAKNNRNVGFRLPWTRYNDVTWSKSNRFAGIAMVIVGIVITLGGIIFSGNIAMIIMLVTLAVALPILTIYAYTVHSKEVKKNNDQKQS